jgi:hypothetical protein
LTFTGFQSLKDIRCFSTAVIYYKPEDKLPEIPAFGDLSKAYSSSDGYIRRIVKDAEGRPTLAV